MANKFFSSYVNGMLKTVPLAANPSAPNKPGLDSSLTAGSSINPADPSMNPTGATSPAIRKPVNTFDPTGIMQQKYDRAKEQAGSDYLQERSALESLASEQRYNAQHGSVSGPNDHSFLATYLQLANALHSRDDGGAAQTMYQARMLKPRYVQDPFEDLQLKTAGAGAFGRPGQR